MARGDKNGPSPSSGNWSDWFDWVGAEQGSRGGWNLFQALCKAPGTGQSWGWGCASLGGSGMGGSGMGLCQLWRIGAGCGLWDPRDPPSVGVHPGAP